MLEKLIIIILSLFCIIQFLYIMNNLKDNKLLIKNLKKIKNDKINKIFVNNNSKNTEMIYTINNIISSYKKKLIEYKNKDESNNDLLTGLSHDIRTPLASLIGYLDALYDNILNEDERKEYIETAKRKAYDLKDYVDLLFDWFKINSKDIVLNFENADINETTREIIIDWLPVFTSKNITLNADINQEIFTSILDINSYKRIINNLIQNAVLHSNCTTLAIKTELNNDKIKIIISDNGKGIEKEKLPYIFNKLYKCDNSRSNKGNGLGLAIVKELINKLNGSIEVVSKPDINTSFIIILPKA